MQPLGLDGRLLASLERRMVLAYWMPDMQDPVLTTGLEMELENEVTYIHAAVRSVFEPVVWRSMEALFPISVAAAERRIEEEMMAQVAAWLCVPTLHKGADGGEGWIRQFKANLRTEVVWRDTVAEFAIDLGLPEVFVWHLYTWFVERCAEVHSMPAIINKLKAYRINYHPKSLDLKAVIDVRAEASGVRGVSYESADPFRDDSRIVIVRTSV